MIFDDIFVYLFCSLLLEVGLGLIGTLLDIFVTGLPYPVVCVIEGRKNMNDGSR